VTAEGIVVKGGSIGAVIERNRIKNSTYAGILVGQSTAESLMDPVQNPNYYKNINAVVRNNIVENTDNAGIGMYAAQSPKIYNNTLINTARTVGASIIVAAQTHTTSTGTLVTSTTDPSIVNAIVTNTTVGSRPLFHIQSNGYTGTLTLDHNRYNNGGGTASFWDERTSSGYYGTWATWPSHTGAEAGSSLGDPGLTADGHLAAGSPSIDAGRTLALVTNDFDGDARSGATDIGADEYVTAVVVTNQPPVAGADAATTLKNAAVKINVLANNTDPNGDRLTVTAVTTPAHGTVVVNSDGTVTYTPAYNYLGADTFRYTIGDGHGGFSTATVTLTVKRK